jgi:hypothetical protein
VLPLPNTVEPVIRRRESGGLLSICPQVIRGRLVRDKVAAMPDPPRRFPTPWHATPMPGGYVVRHANGQALALLNSRDNVGVGSGNTLLVFAMPT